MTNHIDNFRLRIKRARQNITNFNRTVNRFFEIRPYEVITEYDRERPDDRVWVTISIRIRREIPLNLSFMFAECIHNLRSVLDNLVWQLGQLQTPPTSEEVSFPVYQMPNGFPGSRNKTLCRLPKAAYDLIEHLQPYHRANPQEHPLWILNRLWNNDKHRSPVLVANISNETVIDLSSGEFEGAGVAQWSGPMPLDREMRLLGFPVHESKLKDFEAKTHFAPEVILGFNGQAGEGFNASQLLMDLHDFVLDGVVNRFEPFF